MGPTPLMSPNRYSADVPGGTPTSAWCHQQYRPPTSGVMRTQRLFCERPAETLEQHLPRSPQGYALLAQLTPAYMTSASFLRGISSILLFQPSDRAWLPCSCQVARVVRLAGPCGGARTRGSAEQISTSLSLVLRPCLSLFTLAVDHSPGPHPERASSGTGTFDIIFIRNGCACGFLAPYSSMSQVQASRPEHPRRL